MDENKRDRLRVAIPHPEIHLVVRLGPSVRHGLDAHALGVRQEIHRKVVPGGQRTVFARLHMSTYEAVLGVPASEIAGRIVALGDLWGDVATQRLLGRLASAHDTVAAAAILENAIAERIAMAGRPDPHAQLAFHAAARLASANVSTVAGDLGVSERHLRRVFREATGVSPKAFAKLTRFHRALDAAHAKGDTSWADIAAAAGYYDQAHLIAEFRAIAGTTPRALLAELQGAG
ncbi:helix-turn-helix domain-containing protein [Pseudoxanthomonas wuyuanensis]